MKKNLFIYLLAGSMSMIGLADLGKATFIEFNETASPMSNQTQKRTTTEGLVEVTLGSLLILLTSYLASNEGKPLNYDDVTLKEGVDFDFKKMPCSVEDIRDSLNKHKTDFIYIMHHELGDVWIKAIKIKNLKFYVVHNVLHFEANAKVLSFSNKETQNGLIEGLKKILKKLIENKLEHIQEELVLHIGKVGSPAPGFFKGKRLLEVVAHCFKEEVDAADIGKKETNSSKFFPKINF